MSVDSLLFQNRDAELRGITEFVVSSLFRSVLGAAESKDYLLETLTGENSKAVTNRSNWEPTFPALSTRFTYLGKRRKEREIIWLLQPFYRGYGVYFQELRTPRSLQQQMIIELKIAGYSNYKTKESDDVKALLEANSRLPFQAKSHS